MGLWKEKFIGKIQIFMWGGVAHMSDACGPLLEYSDAQKTPTTLIHLFENCTQCIVHRKETNGLVGQTLLQAVQLATHTQEEAEVQVSKLDEEIR